MVTHFEPPRDERGILKPNMTLGQLLMVVRRRGEPFTLTFEPRDEGMWRASFDVVNGSSATYPIPEAAVLTVLRQRERVAGAI